MDIKFGAECPRCHESWTQSRRREVLEQRLASTLPIQLWCHRCGDTWHADGVQRRELGSLIETTVIGLGSEQSAFTGIGKSPREDH